ncbi:MAG TPA: diacylglycerol kinase family protein [Candidatus Binatia bacterium]|nr:diacylglycerol kinase family protein [Candidatus Binatia bacterium]
MKRDAWNGSQPYAFRWRQVQSRFDLAMRKAALLYNPESGGSKQRQKDLQDALEILRAGGVEAELFAAGSRDEAAELTQRAVAASCDTIFACGGDGTVHNLAQVLAKAPAALGILPIGTANALAHDLGLPLKIPAAARAALDAQPRRVALGQIICPDLQGIRQTRYFVIAAGIGVDAHLFYKLHTATKQRLGMGAYYAKAWHMWFTYPMTRFRVEYAAPEGTQLEKALVTELLAVRIREFGGVIRELAPGASLDRDDMRLILCHTGQRLAYLAYVTRALLRRRWTIPGIELAHSVKAVCDYAEPGPTARKIYVEADGELIGSLPAEMSVIPDALTVLAPRRTK